MVDEEDGVLQHSFDQHLGPFSAIFTTPTVVDSPLRAQITNPDLQYLHRSMMGSIPMKENEAFVSSIERVAIVRKGLNIVARCSTTALSPNHTMLLSTTTTSLAEINIKKATSRTVDAPLQTPNIQRVRLIRLQRRVLRAHTGCLAQSSVMNCMLQIGEPLNSC
jgi:hypothetical protein